MIVSEAAKTVVNILLENEADPSWLVTVQADEVPGSGYVQIDDISGGANNWSSGPEALRKAGYDVPDFSVLPAGQYTWSQAIKMLHGGLAIS